MTKLFKKNWQFDLVCAIFGIALAIVLFIPEVATKIVTVLVGILLILFFIFILCPKFKKIKNFNAEWVCWFLIEAVFILTLGILAIVSQKIEIDFLFIKLALSDIIGIVFCIEGVIGLVKLINHPATIDKKPERGLKYVYILAIIIGTYIFATVNISNKDVAIFLGVVAVIFAIVSLIFMFGNFPEKTEEDKKKQAELKKVKEEEKIKKLAEDQKQKEAKAREKDEKSKMKKTK